MEATVTNTILQRVQNELKYPSVLRLSARTLWESGNPRYDLFQYILVTHFDTKDEDCAFFPSQLLTSLRSAQSNDEREQIYLRCFSLLGLCKPTDLSLIQGLCSLEQNVKLLSQLLDLTETRIECQEPLPVAVEKDQRLISQVALKYEQVFTTEVKLFSNDLLSKMPKHEV
jgi:hypothetical protein